MSVPTPPQYDLNGARPPHIPPEEWDRLKMARTERKYEDMDVLARKIAYENDRATRKRLWEQYQAQQAANKKAFRDFLLVIVIVPLAILIITALIALFIYLTQYTGGSPDHLPNLGD